MKKRTNYKIQNGCWNCQYVFEKIEYDEESEYYCNLNDGRPNCGSQCHDERFDVYNMEVFTKQLQKWNQWAKIHNVDCCGVCDKYKEVI